MQWSWQEGPETSSGDPRAHEHPCGLVLTDARRPLDWFQLLLSSAQDLPFLTKITMKVWKVLCFWLKWQVFSQLLGRWGSVDMEGLRGQVACAALPWVHQLLLL